MKPLAAQTWRYAMSDWTRENKAAWNARVRTLTPLDCDDDQLSAVEHRAFCELSPEGRPWREIVNAWPRERRARFARLTLEITASGTTEIAAERQAFLITIAEDDPHGLELRDPAEVAVASMS